MYEAILVPTDGSPAAEDALAHGVSHAERYDAALTLLAVVELSGTATPEHRGGEDIEQRRRDRREQVESLAAGVDAEGVEPAVAVEAGTPSRVILEYAAEHGVDLIVMSTHARSGVGRFLYGSVTEQVIRDGEVPVLAVQR